MQTLLLVTLPKLVQVQVCRELDAISFTYEAPTLPLPPLETPKEGEDSNDEEMDIHLFNDALTSLIMWLAKDFNLVTIITLPTPSPLPPCTQPHSNKEDIHMEPPAPTHVFSEAATQTPAPLPVLAMRPPPLLVMPAHATSMSSKPGPPSRPSFAEAAAKTLCPNAPPFVQGPTQAPQPPKATQGPILSKCSKQPYFATHCPSRSQFFIETPVTTGISLLELVQQANNSLSHARSPLHIDSACFTNSGIMCATASVPTQLDLNIIEAMLPAKIARSWATLPLLQSFIKIINIPYFKPSTMEPPNRQEIGDQLIPSPILVNMIEHIQFIHNSPKADSGTFWIDLVDLQQGTLASSLIG
ncbi:hypothetical protein P691DRAFT_768190 [Macrolepiota fuliginosa MF-IS2]|uniref:Uncharacterized protein n=1 Tax=Macrolepiota fuliginosa MF-IS2 TaxID=1400762 RepID=A0A9P5WZH9_9AGAR|nr:hypothetical protein P691DRAFT_768190 [Macrolepiota fuliginosa MF-IS2]